MIKLSLQFFGGRGGGVGSVSRIDGVKGVAFVPYNSMFGDQRSPNRIWLGTSSPHAVFRNADHEVVVRGDKKNPYELLDHVNTGVVSLRYRDYTKKVNATKLNKELDEIRSRGFEIVGIGYGGDRSLSDPLVFVKRKRFTKQF